MVALSALWLPILLSAVFSFVTLMISHMLPGWHRSDLGALPDEGAVLPALRGLPPGDYRFPYGATTQEMTSPAFVEKMKAGPVGVMTISPSGEMPFGRMMGGWFVYALVIALLAGYLASRTRGAGAPFLEVARVTATVTFCCYAMAHWQNWIWWGKSTRFTLTHTVDGLVYALVTSATFGWLWPQ